MKVVLWAGYCDDISWEAKIQIDSSSNLDVLHLAIQKYVEFDNDHLYEFYTSRNERSRNRMHYNDDNGLVYNTTLDMLYPLKKCDSMYYLFDYGDSWIFKITRTMKKPFIPMPKEKYPKLIEELGNKPIQYTDMEN